MIIKILLFQLSKIFVCFTIVFIFGRDVTGKFSVLVHNLGSQMPMGINKIITRRTLKKQLKHDKTHHLLLTNLFFFFFHVATFLPIA